MNSLSPANAWSCFCFQKIKIYKMKGPFLILCRTSLLNSPGSLGNKILMRSHFKNCGCKCQRTWANRFHLLHSWLRWTDFRIQSRLFIWRIFFTGTSLWWSSKISMFWTTTSFGMQEGCANTCFTSPTTATRQVMRQSSKKLLCLTCQPSPRP